jgi:trimethylamine--corrinoid protein Co-methyltransferase
MNDEIIAMTRRMMRGIEVSDDTLMLDLIDAVGPGGEFISATETARRCRAEIWHPTLIDRQNWVNWLAGGARTMQDRTRARLEKILATHKPPPLAGDATEKIQAVLGAAEAREQQKSRSHT